MNAPTTQAQRPGAPRAGASYLNGVLTVIAALLILVVAQMSGALPAPAQAVAQPGPYPINSGLANPADQRREMIAELQKISAHLERLTGRFSGEALKVEVVKMPAEGKDGD